MQLIDAVQAFSGLYQPNSCSKLLNLNTTQSEKLDIQLVITLSVSRPFPQLQELLSLLRENYSLIRYQ